MATDIERVLVAPLNYSHHQDGQVEAFEHVFGRSNVREFDFWGKHNDGLSPSEISYELYSAAVEFKPDWIWLQLQDSRVILPSVLTNIRRALSGTLVTHWMGDVRESVSDYLAAICHETHATLISSIGQARLYRDAGARIVGYVQIGLDPVDVNPDARWTLSPHVEVPEIVFCGGYYGSTFAKGSAERLSAVRRLQADFGDRFGVFGNGWPDDVRTLSRCHVKQQAHVYRRARCVISINHFNDIERYYSDRFLIALASGTPVVAKRVPGIEAEFIDGQDCFFFDDNDQMVAYVKHVLDGHAIQVGINGRRTAITEHTWEERIRWLVSHDIKTSWMRDAPARSRP